MPSGAFLQSSEQTQECETATIKGALGAITIAMAKPRSKTTATIRVKGVAAITVPTIADFTTLTVTGSKYTETNDDFATSEITGTKYE